MIAERVIFAFPSSFLFLSDPLRNLVQPEVSDVQIKSLSDVMPRLEVQILLVLGTIAWPGDAGGWVSVGETSRGQDGHECLGMLKVRGSLALVDLFFPSNKI